MLSLLFATLLLTTVLGGTAAGSGGRVRQFDVRMSGAEEVPPADPDGTGRFDLRINRRTNEVCFRLRTEDIADPTRAHIHVGAAGTNGPIVVPFFDTAEDAVAEGCVTDEDARAVLADPTNYYCNVHNADFPGGAVRGQLRRDSSGSGPG